MCDNLFGKIDEFLTEMRTKLDDIKRYIIHTFKLNSHLIKLDLNTNMFLPSAAATIAAVYIVPAIILCVNGKPHADTLPFFYPFSEAVG